MTTLPEAQAEFERQFNRVAHDHNIADVLRIYSGGTVPDIKTTAPCLCSTEELAIELWLRSATNERRVAAMRRAEATNRDFTLTWRQPPKMTKLQMTMTDLKKQDRVVTDRYAVYCELAFSL